MNTGNPIVDAVGGIHFEGNIVPHSWYQHPLLRTPANKPNKVAIDLLADIVYWYRPFVVREESTGRILEIRKKFEADMWRIDYQQWADLRGYSKRQVQEAANFLKRAGIIRLTVTDYQTKKGYTIYSAVFIEPVPAILEKLNNPNGKDTPSQKNGRGVPNNWEGGPKKMGGGSPKKVTPLPKNWEHSTESTGETPQENTPDISAESTTTNDVEEKTFSIVEATEQEVDDWTHRLILLRVAPGRIPYLIEHHLPQVAAAVPWWEANRDYWNSRSKPGGAVAASITSPESYPQIYEQQEEPERPRPKRLTKAERRQKLALAYDTVWNSLPEALRESVEREHDDRDEYIERYHANELAEAVNNLKNQPS